jgi:hypothetical protein
MGNMRKGKGDKEECLAQMFLHPGFPTLTLDFEIEQSESIASGLKWP